MLEATKLWMNRSHLHRGKPEPDKNLFQLPEAIYSRPPPLARVSLASTPQRLQPHLTSHQPQPAQPQGPTPAKETCSAGWSLEVQALEGGAGLCPLPSHHHASCFQPVLLIPAAKF